MSTSTSITCILGLSSGKIRKIKVFDINFSRPRRLRVNLGGEFTKTARFGSGYLYVSQFPRNRAFTARKSRKQILGGFDQSALVSQPVGQLKTFPVKKLTYAKKKIPYTRFCFAAGHGTTSNKGSAVFFMFARTEGKIWRGTLSREAPAPERRIYKKKSPVLRWFDAFAA